MDTSVIIVKKYKSKTYLDQTEKEAVNLWRSWASKIVRIVWVLCHVRLVL